MVFLIIGKKIREQQQKHNLIRRKIVMLKRDICDKMYADVIKRYREEKPEMEITNELAEQIWYSIYGVLNHEGEEAARKYAETAKLW